MSDRPTPETDAVLARLVKNQAGNSCDAVVIHHARKMERERDEAREALRAVLELANDIPDESLDDWKIEFHKVLEETK